MNKLQSHNNKSGNPAWRLLCADPAHLRPQTSVLPTFPSRSFCLPFFAAPAISSFPAQTSLLPYVDFVLDRPLQVPQAHLRVFIEPSTMATEPVDFAKDEDKREPSPRPSTSTMVSTGGVTGVDPAYREKSAILNASLTQIGMGRYQWSLFFLCGMGWLADNIWLQGVAIILPQVQTEFLNDVTGSHKISIMTISLYCGLIVGALGWGLASDVIGRRLAFNLTLLIAGIFGTASGGAPTFVGLGFLLAFVGAGVGKTSSPS